MCRRVQVSGGHLDDFGRSHLKPGSPIHRGHGPNRALSAYRFCRPPEPHRRGAPGFPGSGCPGDTLMHSGAASFKKRSPGCFFPGLVQFTRNYTQTVKRAADNNRRYVPDKRHSAVCCGGIQRGQRPVWHTTLLARCSVLYALSALLRKRHCRRGGQGRLKRQESGQGVYGTSVFVPARTSG